MGLLPPNPPQSPEELLHLEGRLSPLLSHVDGPVGSHLDHGISDIDQPIVVELLPGFLAQPRQILCEFRGVLGKLRLFLHFFHITNEYVLVSRKQRIIYLTSFCLTIISDWA